MRTSGRYARGGGRRRSNYPVYCLKHAMDGCSHRAADRVLEVRADTSSIRQVLDALTGEPPSPAAEAAEAVEAAEAAVKAPEAEAHTTA